MTRIVARSTATSARPKRKAVALDVAAIVTRPRKHGPSPADVTPTPEAVAVAPANDDRKSAIITIRSKGRADVSDLTLEEHQRRGDAADALFREMKCRIAEKDQSAVTPSRPRRPSPRNQ